MTGFTGNSFEFGGLLGFGEPTAQRPCYFRLKQRSLREMTTGRGKEHFSQLCLRVQKELQSQKLQSPEPTKLPAPAPQHLLVHHT